MIKRLKLREISVEEFNRYCEERGKPAHRALGDNRRAKRPNKFAELLERISFEGFKDIFGEFRSTDDLYPRCIWLPDGDLSPKQAREATLRQRRKYFSRLNGMEDKYDNIRVEMARIRVKGSHNAFVFGRENESWVLNYFTISRDSLQFYDLEGVPSWDQNSHMGNLNGILRKSGSQQVSK